MPLRILLAGCDNYGRSGAIVLDEDEDRSCALVRKARKIWRLDNAGPYEPLVNQARVLFDE